MRRAGFALKRYWRQPDPLGAWHYFRRCEDGFVSACACARMSKIGGQDKRRPPPERRCAFCDLAEMKLHGVEESVL